MSDYPSMHSLYGRLFGVTYDGFPTAQQGWKDRITAATSATTATALVNYGINTVANTTSAAPTYALAAPAAGVPVKLVCLNAGTSGIATITTTGSAVIVTGPIFTAGPSTAGGAALVTTASTAYTTMKMWQVGQTIELVGLSSLIYQVASVSGFSTSTGGGAILS